MKDDDIIYVVHFRSVWGTKNTRIFLKLSEAVDFSIENKTDVRKYNIRDNFLENLGWNIRKNNLNE